MRAFLVITGLCLAIGLFDYVVIVTFRALLRAVKNGFRRARA